MKYDVALIDGLQAKMVFIPVNQTIESKTRAERLSLLQMLEGKVREKGFEGTVVPVWQGYTGRLKFIAAEEVTEQMRGMDWGFVIRSLNASI